MKTSIVRDPIVYCDQPGRRVLDLRPCGVDCIPVFGRSNFKSASASISEHIHPGCTEICFCRKGNLAFEAAGETYPFLPGMIFVSQANEPHHLRSCPTGLIIDHLLFTPPKAGGVVLGLPPDENRYLVKALTHFPLRLFPSSENVKRGFGRIFELYDLKPADEEERASRSLRLRSAVLELLLAIVEAPTLPPADRGRLNDKLRRIIIRIRQHSDEEYNLEALAAEAGYSSSAFGVAVKKSTGLSPHAFILDSRLRQIAKELASGSAATVTELAKRYRFSSARHLATAFRSLFGQSPSDYRKRID